MPRGWDDEGSGSLLAMADVAFSLAVAASASAGVVVTADEVAYQLTAYSIKDQSVLWHKDAGNAGDVAVPMSPAACLAVSGDGKTFYWASDQLYALDAATGMVRWTGGASSPAEELQSVIVVSGQDSAGPDLVVATTTGPNGGTLRAFLLDVPRRRHRRPHMVGRRGRRAGVRRLRQEPARFRTLIRCVFAPEGH